MNAPKNQGFTLIELLTSISIFAVVMIVSLGSITGIFNANRQTRSLKAVVNNLNLAMETMSKEIRYGTKYHCGEGTFELPQNCPEGGTILSFLSSDNEQITYRLAGTTLEKKVEDGDYAAVTAPELVLEDLKFYALGSGTDNTLQPKVIVKLQGYAGSEKNRSELTLQTLISQRLVDEDPTAPYAYPYPTPEYPTPATFRDLAVTTGGTGSGTVSGPGINCGSDCEESYTDGSNVTLTASPAGVNTFAGWSGACSGIGNCDLLMDANKSVTATFNPSCASGSQAFSYTGAAQTFTVPAGCTSFTVKMWGAGGAGSFQAGGGGGFVQGTVSSTGGTQFVVYVGGGGIWDGIGGGGGYNGGGNGGYPYGGGGGGKSSFYTTGGTPLLHAGGGGGSGTASAGGAGGGSSGVGAPNSSTNGSYCCSYGGGGGTQTSGGNGGTSTSGANGGAGSQNYGGNANGGQWFGGGGGGGYFGGGAGAGGAGSVNDSTGGGGGSGYIAGSVSGGVLTAGSGSTPGNSGDANRAGAGNGGGGFSSGTAGRVYISW